MKTKNTGVCERMLGWRMYLQQEPFAATFFTSYALARPTRCCNRERPSENAPRRCASGLNQGTIVADNGLGWLAERNLFLIHGPVASNTREKR